MTVNTPRTFDAFTPLPPSYRFAMERLAKAVEGQTAACDAYGMAETINGVGSLEAKALDAKVNAAHDAVNAARADLVKAKPSSMGEALQKVVALVAEAMLPEEAEALKAEALEWSEAGRDPLVEMGEEWKRIAAASARAWDAAAPSGFTDPALTDLEAKRHAVEDRMMGMTPQTPEGLAMLADFAWNYIGPCSRPGSEGWEAELTNPEHRLLARLRHGAYIVAGIEADR